MFWQAAFFINYWILISYKSGMSLATGFKVI